jgi:hypothetical protein
MIATESEYFSHYHYIYFIFNEDLNKFELYSTVGAEAMIFGSLALESQ